MNVLTFTTLWPNAQQPLHGLFVRERVKFVANRCELQVVAPVPWAPPVKILGPRYYNYSQIPRYEQQDRLNVFHPVYVSIPKVLKSWGAALMAYSLRSFLRELRTRFAFDLVDAHWAYPDGCAAGDLAKSCEVPYTVTVRGSDITVFARETLRGARIRRSLRQAKLVICVSSPLKQNVIALGIPAEKVVVIENGVDCLKFQPVPRNEARQHLKLPLEGQMIVSVGHISEGKGFHILIDALAQMSSGSPHVSLMIVGGNAQWNGYEEAIRAKIAQHQLQERVFLVGAKPPEELKYWYSAADIFCLASAQEGCPNVVLESLACGTPIVATAVGSIPDILPTQEFGILVKRTADDVQRGISEALTRPWDRGRLVDRAKTQYSWENVANIVATHFEKVYDEFTTQSLAST